ncbi:hypothetical protein Tco_1321480 [Tanacetum coccineum]
MDNPDITLEEYIEVEAEKGRRRGQTFNWENATYGKVRYCEDIDYFKDFKIDLPSVVYKDALASDDEILSEPTVSPHHDNRVDFDFKISFGESDDEDYTVIYDKNLFHYKLIYVNDLKSDSNNDNDEINIPSEDVSTKLLDSVIDSNVNTYSQEVDENFETNHNIHGRYGVYVPPLHQRPQRKQDPIRRIQEDQYAVFKLYGNKILWKISNVVPTPRNPQYAISKTLDMPYRSFSRPYK